MTVGQSLGMALLGFCVVFFMLLLLFVVISILAKVVSNMEKKPAAAPAAAAPAAPAEAPKAEAPKGPFGGEIKLLGLDEKTAACIMAIVSDQTQIPLDQLIFKSIKAVGEE
ncbi:MAG: OadG family protein [Lachnospiraceae bacterium]|nr:OadG family protein [Lachnospiraceae bacterium]